jgi:hypothetical protein
VPGLVRLLRDEPFRALGIANAAAIVGFLLAAGKGYYASPAIAVLCCAGAVAVIERRQQLPRALMAGIAVSLLVSLPLVVPLVPTSVLRENPDISAATEIGERIGWEELARNVGRIVDRLPDEERSRAVVLGVNYTLPTAVEYYAQRYELPTAVSGHNSAYLWWPRLPDDHVAITIGFSRADLSPLYRRVVRVGTVRNSEGVKNYDWGDPIHVARGPKVTQEELRERVKNFTA